MKLAILSALIASAAAFVPAPQKATNTAFSAYPDNWGVNMVSVSTVIDLFSRFSYKTNVQYFIACLRIIFCRAAGTRMTGLLATE